MHVFANSVTYYNTYNERNFNKINKNVWKEDKLNFKNHKSFCLQNFLATCIVCKLFIATYVHICTCIFSMYNVYVQNSYLHAYIHICLNLYRKLGIIQYPFVAYVDMHPAVEIC